MFLAEREFERKEEEICLIGKNLLITNFGTKRWSCEGMGMKTRVR
jgi:hypothetical protein